MTSYLGTLEAKTKCNIITAFWNSPWTPLSLISLFYFTFQARCALMESKDWTTFDSCTAASPALIVCLLCAAQQTSSGTCHWVPILFWKTFLDWSGQFEAPVDRCGNGCFFPFVLGLTDTKWFDRTSHLVVNLNFSYNHFHIWPKYNWH